MIMVNTYIAGTKYQNEDGTQRSEILESLIFDSNLYLENYYFNGEKAVRLLTYEKRCVGNIPKPYNEPIFEYNRTNRIKYTKYVPRQSKSGYISHNITICIKDGNGVIYIDNPMYQHIFLKP